MKPTLTEQPAREIAPRTIAEFARERTALCDGILGLARIYENDINVCVHRREARAELRDAAQALVATVAGEAAGVFQSRSIVSPAAPVWDDLLPAVGLNDFARETLATELNFLTELTADLFLDEADGEEIGVRLSCGFTPPCPRFHVDRVRARLLTTWLGSGTEWIENRDCDRSRLGVPSMSDTESGLIRNPEGIQRAPEQAIIILKGEAWPGFDGRGVVHRSPALNAIGPRVFVSFEPL